MTDRKYHYTYVIHKESTGEYYIGVRSSKLEPNEDPYMGSSSTLKRRMKTEDDWFKFIINMYETRKEADDDEYEQLKHHWTQTWCLNRSAGGLHYRERITTPATRAKISAKLKGKVLSFETKAKISASKKGKFRTAEQRAKISVGHKNPSAETRAKRSAALKGRTLSFETKAKISASLLERNKNG